MIAFLSWCRTSIGSSIVTTLTAWLVLMWSSIDAIVVVLPELGRPGDEHEPALLLGQAGHGGRQAEVGEAGDLGGHRPGHQGHDPPLAIDVHPNRHETGG